jgi:peptidyl-prolyl cis-trans isomerase SurA
MFKTVLYLLLFLYPLVIKAQISDIIFTINDQKVTKAEFIKKFSVNNDLNWTKNKDSVKRNLDQFIEYKLKITEAKARGYDKNPELINELNAFRNELTKRFLADKATMDFLVNQAYERYKTEIRVSQILVRVDPLASAKDSLAAYQKAQYIRKRLLSGENFNKLATELSDDPNASINKGELWYVKPFMLPYEIENYIYSGQQEKISHPIRSKEGYHIVEILEKRPNPGRVKVAHIMLAHPPSGDSLALIQNKKKIDSLFNQLIKGENFENLATKYSDDKGTLNDKGELPWFESGIMPREFEEESYKLKQDGAFSRPVQTIHGWHIIQRISRQNVPEYNQIKEQLFNHTLNDDRSKKAFHLKTERLKKDYQFKESNNFGILPDILDSTIFSSAWKAPLDLNLMDFLFSFNNQTLLLRDFVSYLEKGQEKMFPIPIHSYLALKYEEFVSYTILKHEEQIIQTKNFEIQELINDYKDKILYYKIMENEVWNKVKMDSVALKNYYTQNADKYNKTLSADVCIYSYSINKKAKIEKQFLNFKKLDMPHELIETRMQSTVDKFFRLVECKQSEEGHDEMIDLCIQMYRNGKIKKGDYLILPEDKKILIWLNKNIEKSIKPLEEVKERVKSDFQDNIEKNWLLNLKKKYSVIINENTIEAITNN